MADSINKILLSLELNVDQLEANLQKTTRGLAALKQEQKELQAVLKQLEADGKQSTASYDETTKKIIQNTTAQKLLTVEQSQGQKQLVLIAQANKAAEGSYEQLLRLHQLAQ